MILAPPGTVGDRNTRAQAFSRGLIAAPYVRPARKLADIRGTAVSRTEHNSFNYTVRSQATAHALATFLA